MGRLEDCLRRAFATAVGVQAVEAVGRRAVFGVPCARVVSGLVLCKQHPTPCPEPQHMLQRVAPLLPLSSRRHQGGHCPPNRRRSCRSVGYNNPRTHQQVAKRKSTPHRERAVFDTHQHSPHHTESAVSPARNPQRAVFDTHQHSPCHHTPPQSQPHNLLTDPPGPREALRPFARQTATPAAARGRQAKRRP